MIVFFFLGGGGGGGQWLLWSSKDYGGIALAILWVRLGFPNSKPYLEVHGT